MTAGVAAGSLVALLAVTFLIGTWTGKHNVMDVAWGAGIMVAAGTGERYHCRCCVVWLIGFFFEVVGDWQLARFRADPANRRRILDRGLWRYTRHPNYFGDTCMWWGIFGISYGSAVQLVTIVPPLLMTVILTRGTGQRLTDRRMAQTRPDYAEYAARTSGFIPLPPRPPRRVLPDGYRDRRHHTRPARPRQPSAGGGVHRRPAGRAGVRG